MTEAVPVQTPLTLVLTIKSDEAFRELEALLEREQSSPDGPLRKALDGIGTVHFARFVFLENNTKLAIITTFDGDLDTYINEFVDRVSGLFEAIADRISPAPPTPLRTHRQEFLEFIKRHDMKAVQPFYSAYPGLTVKEILKLAQPQQT
jgi:hypothetical protein